MMRLDPGKAEPWLALADADIAIADLVLREPDSSPEMLGLASFHAHQCAEKMVKGVLAALGRRMPYSHDIVELLEIMADLDVGDDIATAAAALNEYGVAPRYPRAPGAGTREAALAARECAIVLRAWAMTVLAGVAS